MQELLQIQLIEKYLSNQLGHQERTDLEIRLLTDEKLARLFHQIENAINGIRSKSRKHLLDTLKAWDRPAKVLKMDHEISLEDLDDLLSGKLSDTEAKALQAKIDQDVQLKSEHDGLDDMIKGIRYKGRKDLLSKMAQWDKNAPDWKPSDEDRKPKGRIVLLRRIASVAAMIAIVCAAVFMWPDSNQTEESVFASHFTVYPNMVMSQTRTEGNVDPVILAETNFPQHDPIQILQAFRNFDATNYEQSSTLFAQLLETSYDANIQFYYAQSLMARGEFELALNALLASEEKTNNSVIQKQSIWYAGLCMLELGQNAELQEHWKTFKEGNCKQCWTAKDILKELNR